MLFPLEFLPSLPIRMAFLRVVGGRVGRGGISESLHGSFKYS